MSSSGTLLLAWLNFWSPDHNVLRTSLLHSQPSACSTNRDQWQGRAGSSRASWLTPEHQIELILATLRVAEACDSFLSALYNVL